MTKFSSQMQWCSLAMSDSLEYAFLHISLQFLSQEISSDIHRAAPSPLCPARIALAVRRADQGRAGGRETEAGAAREAQGVQEGRCGGLLAPPAPQGGRRVLRGEGGVVLTPCEHIIQRGRRCGRGRRAPRCPPKSYWDRSASSCTRRCTCSHKQVPLLKRSSRPVWWSPWCW